jgi:hypothetical protein
MSTENPVTRLRLCASCEAAARANALAGLETELCSSCSAEVARLRQMQPRFYFTFGNEPKKDERS